MSRSGPGLQRRLSRLDGRLPSSALDELNDRELWALQRDLIDAALDNEQPGSEVLARVRTWARSFQIGGQPAAQRSPPEPWSCDSVFLAATAWWDLLTWVK